MKIPQWLALLLICINCFIGSAVAQGPGKINYRSDKDTVVIPFEYKQSALYQKYTLAVLDSIVELLLVHDSATLSIDGYAHQDEGNDTITKYLSLNRALFIKTYVFGRGIDSSRIISVKAYGKTRQLYRGTLNMGLGNCRAVIKINYPIPPPPPTDRDNDGILDTLDACPDEFGDKARNGCPNKDMIIIPFDNQQSALYAGTFKVLDSVITILKQDPTITIAIQGHAFETEGNNSLTGRLSKDRAEIVKGYLLSRYVGAARIESVSSFGSQRPLNAGKNPREILRNSRAEIYLNRHL